MFSVVTLSLSLADLLLHSPASRNPMAADASIFSQIMPDDLHMQLLNLEKRDVELKFRDDQCEEVIMLRKELSFLSKEREGLLTRIRELSELSNDHQSLNNQLCVMSEEKDKLVTQIEEQQKHAIEEESLNKRYNDLGELVRAFWKRCSIHFSFGCPFGLNSLFLQGPTILRVKFSMREMEKRRHFTSKWNWMRFEMNGHDMC